MRKQTTVRKRSSRRSQGPSRLQSRRRTAKKQRALALRLSLVVVLIAMGVWTLMRVPPGLLIAGSITTLLLIFLLIVVWLVLRYRLTPEEQDWHTEQQMEFVQMEDTANALGVRLVEINDLAHLGHKEFESFVGALLEAMGIAHDIEQVGGARDRGIDLRGKNGFDRLLIVQCKHFAPHIKVNPGLTREFGGTIGLHGSHEAWFVTTSSFTKQAVDDVRHFIYRGSMVLVDGSQLVAFIRDHWDALPAQWQWRLTECMAKSDR